MKEQSMTVAIAASGTAVNGVAALSTYPPSALEFQRFLLFGITWPQYVTIADALPDRGGLRMTFDRGRLEFMTLSPLHEKYKVRLGRLLEVLAEVFSREI